MNKHPDSSDNQRLVIAPPEGNAVSSDKKINAGVKSFIKGLTGLELNYEK